VRASAPDSLSHLVTEQIFAVSILYISHVERDTVFDTVVVKV
jgi:hypothetical protein